MKTRNHISRSIICLLMVVLCVAVLGACDIFGSKECNHTWSEWTTAKDATCEVAGQETRTCSQCGKVEKAPIDATGHKWADATCTAPSTCTVCNETNGYALAHTFDKEVVKPETLKSAATEKSAAVYYKSCSCGAISRNSAETFEYGSPLEHTHTYSSEVTAPTCTSGGYTTYSCSCGYSYTDDNTPALDHKGGKATCNTLAKCEVCGVSYGKLGDHAWVDATCTKEKHCSVCGVTEGEKLAHVGGTATCKELAKCSECGTEYGEFADHEWVDATCTKEKHCSVCGVTEGEKLAHVGGTATCEELAKCSECGTRYGKLADHKWGDATCTEEKRCSVCGTTEGEKLPHVGGTATCTTQAKCDVCGNSYGAFGAHDWKDATCTEAKNCRLCGTSEGDALGHTGGNATCIEKAICDRCSMAYGETAAHSYDKNADPLRYLAKEATCESAEEYYYSCSDCGKCHDEEGAKTFFAGEKLEHEYDWVSNGNGTHTGTCHNGCEGTVTNQCTGGTATCTQKAVCEICQEYYGEALGHTWVDGAIITAPTCTGIGQKEQNCQCGATTTVSIPAPGHAYNSETVAPTCVAQGYTVYTCSACDYSYKSDYQEALGHSFGEWAVSKEATCTATGVQTHTCACGAVETQVIPALGHNHTADTTAPTCVQKGYTTYTCSCGDSYVGNETAPAGHAWNINAPTCTEDQVCATCGERVDAIGHDYKLSDSTAATCVVAATNTYTCENCQHSYTESVGTTIAHNVEGVSAELVLNEGETCIYTEHYQCKECGADVVGETVEKHAKYTAAIRTAATCTTEGVKVLTCAECGYTKEESIPVDTTLGHTWVAGAVVGNKRTDTCACGETKVVTVVTEDQANKVDDLKDTELSVGDANINFGEAADSIGSQTNNDVTIGAGTLDAEEKQGVLDTLDSDKLGQIGDNPIYNFTVTDTENNLITDFGGKVVTITIPYVLAEGEDVDSIAIWFINDQGEVESIPATYNNGYVTFTTNHFSYYTVTKLNPADRCEVYGHNFKESIVAPTCTEQGYTLQYCIRCRHSEKVNYVDPLDHTYTSKIEKNATCTENGLMKHTCSVCNGTYEEIIPAIKHNYVFLSETKATCTAAGVITYKCSNCQGTKTEQTAPIGHSCVAVQTVAPTCTTRGYTVYACQNEGCDYSYNDNYQEVVDHTFGAWTVTVPSTCTTEGEERRDCANCEHYETQKIAVVPHNYVGVVTAPTCDQTGYTTYTCSLCQDTYVGDVTAAIGHSYTAAWTWAEDKTTATVSITCQNAGCQYNTTPFTKTVNSECTVFDSTVDKEGRKEYSVHVEFDGHSFSDVQYETIPVKEHTHEDCEMQYNKFNHWYKCPESKGNSGKIPHEFDEGTVVKEATCKTEGEIVYKCFCGYEKTESIPKNDNHTAGTELYRDASTHWNVCTACGEKLNETKHAWDNGTVTRNVTCTEKGIITYRCECGASKAEEVPAFGHTEKELPAVDATCTKNGLTAGVKCDTCNEVLVKQEVIKAPGHNEVISPAIKPTCTQDGKTESSVCSVCGEVLVKEEIVPALGHTEEIIPGISASCTESGITEGKKCSACGETLVEQKEIPATGHSFGEWIETKAPTEKEAGEKTRYCANCDAIETSVIAPLGHSHKNYPVINLEGIAPTCTKEGLTEGQMCSGCGEVLVPQEIIPALGHTEAVLTGKETTCTENGLTEGIVCVACGEILVEQAEIPAFGHIGYEDDGICDICQTIIAPEGDFTLTIEQAIALALSQEHNVYTKNKYYVTGVIKEVYNATYGNMRITDEKGNILTIYGAYSADGSIRYDSMEVQPVAGDTITIYGIIGQYNGTPQIKNGWVVVHNGVGPEETTPEETTPDETAPEEYPDIKEDVALNGVVNQNKLGQTLYLDGTMSGRYLNTTDDVTLAVSVYAARVEEGYCFYIVADGEKQYISILKNEDGKLCVAYSTDVQSVYRYDSARNAWINTFDGIDYYLGAYNVYNTVSASKIDYITPENTGVSQFPLNFVIAGSDTPAVPDTPVDPEETTPEETTPDTPDTPDVPAEGSTLTIKEAIELGASQEHNGYTKGKYYVTGVVQEIRNSTYGNLYLVDENGNSIYVYGTYSADGSVRFDKMEVQPVVGDTITIYGIIGQYNGTPQIKNGWIVSYNGETPEETTPEETTPDTPDTPDVPADGVIYSTIEEIANANGWVTGNPYESFELSGGIIVSVVATPATSYGLNSGKFYTTDYTWRLYQNEGPVLFITAPDNTTIEYVKITYISQKDGVLVLGDKAIESDTLIRVDANGIIFCVGNISSIANGQVRITAFEIGYKTDDACAHEYTETERVEPTCTTDGYVTYTCGLCGKTTTQNIPAPGHVLGEFVVTKEPTCVEYGEMTANCTVCGAIATEYIPAYGHNFQDGYCTICGSPVNCETHDYGNRFEKKWGICLVCGYVDDNHEHSIKNGKCVYCDYEFEAIEVPSLFDNDGDGATDIFYFSAALPEEFTGEDVIWLDAFNDSTGSHMEYDEIRAGSGSLPYPHVYNADKNTSHSIVFTIDVETAGLYNVAVHYRIKDAQTRGARFVINEGTANEQAISYTYGWNSADEAYECRNNDFLIGSYMTGLAFELQEGVNTITIRVADGVAKTQHFRDLYLVRVDACKHEYTETERVEPTCTIDGYVTKVCGLCEKVKTTVLPATGHMVEAWNVVKQPTCTTEGEMNATCTVCGEAIVQILPAFGHSFGNYTVTKEPTCTEYGEWMETCYTCGETQTGSIYPNGHYWETYEDVKLPTCTENGERVYTCACGETMSEILWETGHYVPNEEIIKQATCTEDGEAVGTCTNCGETVTRILYATGHSTTYERIYFSDLGITCGGNVRIYTCVNCGVNTQNRFTEYCSWSNNGVDEATGATVYTCSYCGAVKHELSQKEYEGAACKYTLVDTRMYYVANELVLTVANRTYYEDHQLQYEFVLNGTSCTDGYTVKETCKTCDLLREYTGESHNYYRTEYYDFTKYGACRGYFESYTCPCGEYFYRNTNYCSMSTISTTSHVDDNGIEHSVTVYQCPTCGFTRTRDRYYLDEGCYTYRYYVYTFSMDGVDIASYTEKSQNSSHHAIDYTFTFLDENNKNCEAGVVIKEACRNCDYVSEWTTYSHSTYRVAYYNLTDYGACYGYIEVYSCGCGQSGWTNTYYCAHNYVSGDTYTDDAGYTHNVEVYECPTCGIRRTRDYYDVREGCYTYRYYTESYVIGELEVGTSNWKSQVNTHHEYEYTYTFADEANKNCEAGVTVVTTCKNCDYRSESYRSHHSNDTFFYSDWYVCCDNHDVQVYGCPCGKNFTIQFNSNTFNYNEETKLYTCQNCALAISRVVDVTENGCSRTENTTLIAYLSGAEKYRCTREETYSNHNYSDVKVSVKDGTTVVTVKCSKCNNEIISKTQQVVLENHDGTYYYDYSFTPEVSATYVIQSYSSRDTYVTLYELVEDQLIQRDYNDDGAGNGQFYLTTYLEAGKTYVYRIRFYSSGNSGTIDFSLAQLEAKTEINCTHTSCNNFVVLVEGATDCTEGAFGGRLCPECGRLDQTQFTTSHDTFRVEYHNFSDYGACYGYIEVYSCACGYSTGINRHYCTYNYVSSSNYTDDAGITHYTEVYECSNCGLRRTYEYYDARKGCYTYRYYTETYTIGETEICTVEWKSQQNSHHEYEYSYTFADEANKTCEAGVTLVTTCKNCDYRSEDYYTHHATFRAEYYDFTQYGACSGYLEVYSCPCGKEVSCNRSYCAYNQVSSSIYADNAGVWHYVTVYECPTCGLTRTQDYYKQKVGCTIYTYYTETYSIGETEIGTGRWKNSTTRHNYEYIYTFADEANKNCEAGVTVITTCKDCTYHRENYYTSHSVHRKEYYDFTEHGACSGGYMEVRSCACGYSTSVNRSSCASRVSSSNYTDDAGITHYVELYECSECGLNRTREYYDAREGCYTYRYYTETYSIRGVEIASGSWRSQQNTHHEYEYSYTFADEANKTCEAGFTVVTTCKNCDYRGESYYTHHATFRTEYYDFTKYGACYGYLEVYSCPCGKETSANRHYCSGNQVSSSIYADDAGVWHYLTVYECPTCGLTRTQNYYNQKEGCYIYRYYTETYSIGGTEIGTGKWKSHQETRHNYEYTYTFADEANKNCEAGVTVVVACKDCNYSYQNYHTYHNTYRNEYYDFTEHGVCYGYLEVYSCACGQNTGIGTHYCANSYVSNSSYTDDAGITHYTEVYECSNCGLRRTREYYDVREGCYTYRYYTETYSIRDVEIASGSWRSQQNSHHEYEYSYTFADEANKTCEAGFTVVTTCKNCDYRSENYYTYHATFRTEYYDLTEYGACRGYLEVLSCPCGKEVSCNRSYCANNQVSSSVYMDEAGVWHYVYIYACTTCGLTRTQDYYSQKEGCSIYRYYTETYVIGGTEIGTGKWKSHYQTRHDYEYTYTFADETNKNCEAGVTVVTTCKNCDYHGESYYTSHSTRRIEYYDFTEYGACSGGYMEIRSCACGYSTSANINGCTGSHVSTTTYMDDAGITHYVERYECTKCGLNRVNEYYDVREGCYTYRYYTYTYFIRDVEIGSGSWRSQQNTHHKYEYEYTFADEANKTCTAGVTVVTTCKNCDYHSQSYYTSHPGFRTQYYDLTEYGATGGYVYVNSCPCGYYSYAEFSSCAHGTYYNTNEYTDEDGVRWYVETWTTSCECQIRFDRAYRSEHDTENCLMTHYYEESLSIGDTLITVGARTNTETYHVYNISLELKEGATNCGQGVIVTEECRYCDVKYVSTNHYHYTTELERFDLTQYGAVCEGYATINGCACGYERSLSVSHCDCAFYHNSTTKWIEGIIPNGYYYTAEGGRDFYSYAYTYTCAVTDPTQCGFIIRYSTYWLKNKDCSASQYLTVQFGYDRATDTCQYEVTYKLTDRTYTYHNYVRTDVDNGFVETCPDCGSYHSYMYYYNDQGIHIKTQEIWENKLDDGCRKYREHTHEYVGTHEGRWGNYETSSFYKYIEADGNETWDKYEYSYAEYQAPFGENGYIRTEKYSHSNGDVYTYEYTYTQYKGYDFILCQKFIRGEYWEKNEYAYDFTNGCKRVCTYTDSNGSYTVSSPESAHPTWHHTTIIAPTCTQYGLQGYWCPVCEEHWGETPITPNGHNWSFLFDNLYYCRTCGLQNINGANGDIVMEDLTDKYGKGEAYVIGYWKNTTVSFTPYVIIYLNEPMEIDGFLEEAFVLYLWDDQFHFVRDEYVGLYVTFADIQAAVEMLCEDYGIEVFTPDMYTVSISFVPDGADDNFDYAIVFGNLPGSESADGVIRGNEVFIDYVAEGEYIDYTIVSGETTTWVFESYVDSGDPCVYLLDANGNQLLYNDDYNGRNFRITYTLQAGETYVLRVCWLHNNVAGYIPTAFHKTTNA